MASKRLEMIFKNEQGRTSKLSLDNARADLAEAEVQTAMQAIIDKNIFEFSGGVLVGIDGARVVTTDVTEIIK